jgi:type II secretory pathway component PulJ
MQLTLPSPSINIAEGSLRRQAGVTLTDLLVGTTVGALVLIGISTTYVLGARSTSQNVEQARLNQELRAVLEIMQQDIRRAGYWDMSDVEDADPAQNPFQSTIDGIDRRLRTGQVDGESPGSCVLYSYDFEPDNATALTMFGFRLRNQYVQVRTGPSSVDDKTFECTIGSGSWERITSDDVRITALRFTIETAQTNLTPEKEDAACATNELCRETRRVAILMAGQIRDDPAVRQSLQATVAVRNDRYFVKE